MKSERYPLPFGWVKEFDQASGNPFYVDTKANPPRSIWTHPYEDEEYLKAHPDVQEKINAGGFGCSESNLPPPSFEESQRRHSFGGAPPSSRSQTMGIFPTQPDRRGDRGFLVKLKDIAIGIKEEHEAEQRRRQEEYRVRMEAQRQYMQMMIARQRLYGNRPQFGHGHGFMPGGPKYGSRYGSYGTPGGDMGMGLPLLGGFAGGLLLGDALNNYSGGGDFGGGDFSGGSFGGDFSGGDFGGGGFGGGDFGGGDFGGGDFGGGGFGGF